MFETWKAGQIRINVFVRPLSHWLVSANLQQEKVVFNECCWAADYFAFSLNAHRLFYCSQLLNISISSISWYLFIFASRKKKKYKISDKKWITRSNSVWRGSQANLIFFSTRWFKDLITKSSHQMKKLFFSLLMIRWKKVSIFPYWSHPLLRCFWRPDRKL